MVIKFTNFSDGVHFFELTKSCTEMEIGEPFKNDVLLKCKMDKSHHQIYISCDLFLQTALVCDRCNAEFNRTLTNHFENLYLFSREQTRTDEIGVYQLSPDSDKIDLTDDSIEYAKLAVPMKILCSEDCKGLCVKCGANLNDKTCECNTEETSFVWEPLQKIKDKLN